MDSEIEKEINRIVLSCRHPVNEILAGEYHSVFKGRGLDFNELREYQFGDDVRLIDWNVTARTGRPHIKCYIEERELSVYLMVDFSASTLYSTVEKSKRRAASELCALLSFSANKNNDKVSLIIFTDKVELYIPPGKGRMHIMNIIEKLLTFEPDHKGTNISSALDFLAKITRKHSVAFLISDFMTDDFREQLAYTALEHDLTAISVADKSESAFPPAGLLKVKDSETGETVIIDSDRKNCPEYRETALKRRIRLNTLFQEHKVDLIEIDTAEDYVRELVNFFRRRERRVADETGG